MKLTDTLEEQAVLEDLVEEVKPPIPPECEGLHYLLSTPFRYAPYPNGSRFRRASQREGAFYGAERLSTALAELAFYRLLFFAVAPHAILPQTPAELTAICIACEATAAIDLTAQPFAAEEARWTDLTDYRDCQQLADAARAADIQAIRYRSVRDPAAGVNVAIIDPRAFGQSSPLEAQTWRMLLTRSSVRLMRDVPALERLEFDVTAFAADPRIAAALKSGPPA